MKGALLFVLLFVGAAAMLSAVRSFDDRLPLAAFKQLVAQGEVVEVEIREDAYVARGKPDPASGTPRSYVTGRIEGAEHEMLTRLDERGIPYTRVADEGILLPALMWGVPLAAGALLLLQLGRRAPGGGLSSPALSFGKHRARLYEGKGRAITFDDVAGCLEAKEELSEIVEFLRSPERVRRLGGRVPRGVLLVGPPGTGKTLLARAVAGEASVPFYSICGSEFVELFVGVGAARVRDLFAQAREKPAAIVFVDELDAVGKTRGVSGALTGNDEREQTLNQLLTEMDGFDERAGVVVLAATNRPEVLDVALLRAGRFDRRIAVDRPDLAERRQILDVCVRRVLLGPDVDLDKVASATAGLVGADLANVSNEAALLAARRRGSFVAHGDFEEAVERVAVGLGRKGRRLGHRDKMTVAYHEAGHAIVAELLGTQDPVQKVSIVPRGGGALGFTMQRPLEDRYLLRRGEILDRLVVLLGGRAAEREALGDVSTGAQDDLAKATDLARRMVRELGMSRALGPSALDAMTASSAGVGGPRDPSDATTRVADDEVLRLLEDAEVRARDLMVLHRPVLERVARRLFDTETLDGDELRKLIAA